jgi:hypothetical protein
MAVPIRLALIFAGLAAAGSAAPAAAQCRLCDQPTTARPVDTPSGDVDLQIETSLNFDRLVLSGTGQGAAVIRPSGPVSAEGAVLEISPRATVGTILVHGEPNRAVAVDLPHRIELYSAGGGRISLVDVTTDLQAFPRLDAAGNLSFHFGGRLTVTGDDDGQFRGDLPITVVYAADPSASAGNLSAR